MTTESMMILILIAVFMLLVVEIYEGITAFKKHAPFNLIPYCLMLLGILFAILVVKQGHELKVADWAQILLTLGLLVITATYAWSTEKMAKEMREQRVTTSRPFIIQRAEQKKAVKKTITTDYFSHFEIYNAGNGPTIELEICFLDEEKRRIYNERQSYLRAGESVKLLPIEFGKEQSLPDIEPPVKLAPINLAREKQTYLVSEYQNTLSTRQKPTWYQCNTWRVRIS
jgi:hypothetical protein